MKSLHKIVPFFFLCIYCFSSSILVHNSAMHHHSNHWHDTHTITLAQDNDNCCDEKWSEKSCFKKCFWEYTKIFSSKVNIYFIKYIVFSHFFELYTNQKYSIRITSLQYRQQQSTSPPNIFLTDYIGTIKIALYA